MIIKPALSLSGISLSLMLLTLAGCHHGSQSSSERTTDSSITPAVAPFDWAVIPAPADIAWPYREGYQEGGDHTAELEIAPGLIHRFDSISSMPLTINVLTADLSRPGLRIDVEKGGSALRGLEKVESVISRLSTPENRVLAGMNGDFWNAGGVPVSMFVDEGMIWKASTLTAEDQRRPVFAYDDQGNIFFGRPLVSLSLESSGGERLAINSVNMGDGDVAVYTWPHGAEAPALPENHKQLVLYVDSGEWLPNTRTTASLLSVDMPNRVTLDRNTMAIHVKGELPAWLEQGQDYELVATFEGLPGKVVGTIGGGPRLVVDGVADPLSFAAADTVGERFVTDLHPRSALGVKADGKTLVFVVVDGRQPRRSKGIDLIDLAELMKDLGCEHAINLDGGGSSTMVAHGSVVNFPSDANGARSVTNSVLVRRIVPQGPPATLTVTPNDARFPVGTLLPLHLVARDYSGEEVSLEGWKVRYLVTPADRIAMDERGIAYAAAPGAVRVVARAEKDGRTIRGEVHLTVTESFRVYPTPDRLMLSNGGEASINLISMARIAGGAWAHPLATYPAHSVPDFLDYNPWNRTITAKGAGFADLEFMVAGDLVKIPVAVERSSATLISGMDVLPSADMGEWIVLLNATRKRNTLSVETDNKLEGAGAWRWEYAMDGRGTTKIALPVNLEVPGNPLAIGLSVYGDGQKQWLRGILDDSQGNTFYLDFLDARREVNWKDEWRNLTASLQNPVVIRSTSTRPIPPLTIREIYLVQPQEAAKRDGVLLLDKLEALDLPTE